MILRNERRILWLQYIPMMCPLYHKCSQLNPVRNHAWIILPERISKWLGITMISGWPGPQDLLPRILLFGRQVPKVEPREGHLDGDFHKWGVPENGWFILAHPIDMDDCWGYPHFRKPPNVVFFFFKNIW